MATFDELRDADLIVHVTDASHPQCDLMVERVETILREMDLHRIPTLLLFNKCDQISADTRHILELRYPGAVFVSALDPESLRPLERILEARLFEKPLESLVAGGSD